MTVLESDTPRSTQLKLYTILLVAGWTLAIITSVFWNIHLQNEETKEIALNVARTQLRNDSLYRSWNILHGGIYVPVTPQSPPDEYLADIPERDITTPSGRLLTLNSHAYMMEQVYKLSESRSKIRHHISSLDPVRAENLPDEWETRALEMFEHGKDEVSAVTDVDNEPHIRLMHPFRIVKACLKCHSRQGYSEGDIRGGISVTMPMSVFEKAKQRQMFSLVWGHILWWLLGVAVIVIGYFNINRRIGERREAEKALAYMKKQQERILNAAGEGIYGVDRNGVITFVNPASAAMLGRQPEELVGRDQHSIMHHLRANGSSYPKEQGRISESVAGGKVYHGDNEIYIRKDGTLFPIEYISTPIVENGEILGAVVTFSDITERKKAEEEMASIRLYLQNIFDSMPSVLVAINRSGQITQWNEEAEKMTGLTFNQIKGDKIDTIFSFLEGQIDRIQSAMTERTPLSIEKLQTVIDGTIRFFDVISYPLVFQDVEGAVIRIDDVTARTLQEEKEMQADKMTSVAGLAEGMAHEINNPLGGIMQGAQSVLRRVSPALAKNAEVALECGTDLEKIRDYMQKRKIFDFLEGIRSSGERAASIVSYMQQFSRSQDAITEIRNLGYLAERALELINNDHNFLNDVPFDRIELAKEFAPDLPDILCSPLEVEQVIVNLIKNAAQALFDDYEIAAPRIVLRVYMENGEAVIEVEDNGPGFSEEIAKRIFEPFFTTKPPGKGTGLGLAVAYFIITVAHRGTLTVRSIPGQGANFKISIPTGFGSSQ